MRPTRDDRRAAVRPSLRSDVPLRKRVAQAKRRGGDHTVAEAAASGVDENNASEVAKLPKLRAAAVERAVKQNAELRADRSIAARIAAAHARADLRAETRQREARSREAAIEVALDEASAIADFVVNFSGPNEAAISITAGELRRLRAAVFAARA